MKYECEVVQDLMPLYIDEVCSEQSRNIVDRHLEECNNCTVKLEELRQQEVTTVLSQDKNKIIEAYKKKQQKRSTLIGIITAGVLMIPLIVCLICNIAVGHKLDWFFIVLTSLWVFASITVVPLLVNEKKFFWTLVSFSLSLTALLGTCCIYSGGNWFFVAVVPTLAGLIICFSPYLVRQIPLSVPMKNHKAALAMAADTIAVFSIVVTAGLYGHQSADYWRVGLLTTSFCMLLPWLILLTARYLKIKKGYKGAVISLLTAFSVTAINDFVALVLGDFEKLTILSANLFVWNNTTINGNIHLIIVLSGVVSAIISVAIGALAENRKKS